MRLCLAGLFLHLGTLYCIVALPFPFCGPGKDSYGTWLSTAHYENSTTIQAQVRDRFWFGGPGSATEFSHIWVPDDCAYHRFTNGSLMNVLSHMRRMANSTDPIRIIVLGDSGTRGILCGLVRILTGSEIVGPCANDICGTSTKKAASLKEKHQLFNLNYGQDLELTFMYIKSLTEQYSRWMVEENMHKKPYALLLNTGIWDFGDFYMKHREEVAQDLCSDEEAMGIAERRVQAPIRDMFAETARIAKSLGVRAIYRQNHLNSWFGSHCADDLLLPILKSTGWEVWDNRRISQHAWTYQNHDGFHFDRGASHTVEEHQQERLQAQQAGRAVPGQLEMQLTQSLLHTLFGQVVQEMFDQGMSL